MVPNEITITKEDYFQLMCDSLRLSMLQNAGVNNWEWYGEAFNPEGEEDYNAQYKELRRDILGI
jgi:hypothetical protein